MAWIWSHHLYLQWKFKLLAGKFTWGTKAKHCWVMSTNFLKQKVLFDNAQHLKQSFPPIIWILNEGEGDGIESWLPFKFFSTTLWCVWYHKGFLPFDFLDEILKQIVCYQMEPNHYKMGLLPILGILLSHLVVLLILLEPMPYSKSKTHKSEKIDFRFFFH